MQDQPTPQPPATRVLRYPIAPEVTVPGGSTFLHCEGNSLWFLVPKDPIGEAQKHHYFACGTGAPLPEEIHDCRFVTTLLRTVFCPKHGIHSAAIHIFEVPAHLKDKFPQETEGKTDKADWWKTGGTPPAHQ